jgi:hypothetical protein
VSGGEAVELAHSGVRTFDLVTFCHNFERIRRFLKYYPLDSNVVGAFGLSDLNYGTVKIGFAQSNFEIVSTRENVCP